MPSQSEDEWGEALDRHTPEYAITYEDSFNYLSKMCLTRMREAAFTMSEAAKKRGCTVVISGSDATDHKEKYFAHGADAIIIGEGEIPLGETLDALTGRSDADLKSIPGLALPDAPEPQSRGFLKDLDGLPFP